MNMIEAFVSFFYVIAHLRLKAIFFISSTIVFATF